MYSYWECDIFLWVVACYNNYIFFKNDELDCKRLWMILLKKFYIDWDFVGKGGFEVSDTRLLFRFFVKCALKYFRGWVVHYM